jgi:hypothetical protein
MHERFGEWIFVSHFPSMGSFVKDCFGRTYSCSKVVFHHLCWEGDQVVGGEGGVVAYHGGGGEEGLAQEHGAHPVVLALQYSLLNSSG